MFIWWFLDVMVDDFCSANLCGSTGRFFVIDRSLVLPSLQHMTSLEGL